jgi:hypothetical protein
MTTPIEDLSRPSLPPQTSDLPPPIVGAPLTKAQAAELEDQRKPWHRAKWLTTAIGQFGILGMFALCALHPPKDSDLFSSMVFAFGLITGAGVGGQSWVDGLSRKK